MSFTVRELILHLQKFNANLDVEIRLADWDNPFTLSKKESREIVGFHTSRACVKILAGKE